MITIGVDLAVSALGTIALAFVLLGSRTYVACRDARDYRAWYADATRRYASLSRSYAALNPYAALLGAEVEARVYAESRWERMVVVAVSWRGAVAVRPRHDLATRARWIRAELVPDRVREVTGRANDDAEPAIGFGGTR